MSRQAKKIEKYKELIYGFKSLKIVVKVRIVYDQPDENMNSEAKYKLSGHL